ncbi:MAG: ThiF family adenylyltransferase [Candidatus Omnitrophica bacterium]|nr:ThiF family adenylyltransferase [Candidatus Omnitrophota bacterium]
MKDLSRYQRQFLLPEIGPEGQAKISSASVAIVGLGALGSVSANLLARAGVGRLRLIDRDVVELGNLQRQVLYDETDARENFPKAAAAERKLRQINSEIVVEGEAADLNPETIEELFKGIDLVVDGTDNFETRYLINDYCLREKLPWIYGGAVAVEGLTYVILPGEGPCLRCLFEEAPRPGEFQTCDRAGILAPVAHWVASFQSIEALKILAGRKETVDRRLWKGDLWKKEFRAVDAGGAPRSGCSGCRKGEYPYLDRERGSRTVTLCGRNAVQIFSSASVPINFKNLADKLSPFGAVHYNDYLLQASVPPFEITIFLNGRAIVKGTEDASEARGVYAKYIGS